MFDDDAAIQALERSMEDLKRAKLDHPGPPMKDEIPSRPFGILSQPSFEQIVGRRTEKFTEKEKSTNEIITSRREEAREALEKESRQLSVGDSGGLAGMEDDSLSSRSSSPFECTRL